MRVLLSLDLSTTCTGWAKFDLDTGELLSHGFIKPDFANPKKKGIPLFSYPQAQILKLRRLTEQVNELILADESIAVIVIEEINRGKNRLGQKVLDGFHMILLENMHHNHLLMVRYIDSDGREGWRSANGLKLQLAETDKLLNKDRKKFNKKLGRGQKKSPIITQKTLACRFVNKKYNLNLNADENESDGDVADAIGLGTHMLEVLNDGQR